MNPAVIVACCMLSGFISGGVVWLLAWNAFGPFKEKKASKRRYQESKNYIETTYPLEGGRKW